MRRLEATFAKQISIDFEGEPLPALEGEPLACALLAHGEHVFSRSVKYHRPRGPFCFSGECSQCLMRVDAAPNIPTCRVPAKSGMKVARQNAYPTGEVDIFRAIDWLFPKGLDHHEMFAGVPVAEQLMQKVARHLAGLGLLPEDVVPAAGPAEELKVAVAIVGGGPAGLGAALALRAQKVPLVLFEREGFLGGRLAIGAPEPADPAIPSAEALSGAVRLNAAAIGLYSDAQGRFLAVLDGANSGPRLRKVYAEVFLLAPGGYASVLPFENNDLPGILSGRAASRLIRRHAMLPGEAPVLLGSGPEMYALARLFERHGARPQAILDIHSAPGSGDFKAHGQSLVHAFSFRERGARSRTVDCDCVAVCLLPAPSFELARHAGVRVDFQPLRGAFAIATEEDGRTDVKDVFVLGDAARIGTAAEQWAFGDRAARAALGQLT